MRVAVTGASGCVGRETAASLLARGDCVTAVGRAVEDLFKVDEQVFVSASDYSFESLKRAFEGADAVLHLAARRWAEPGDGFTPFLHDNIKITDNAFRAAVEAGVKKFIFASSISVYSSANRSPFLESENAVP